MKKSDSNNNDKDLVKELKQLRKENERLKLKFQTTETKNKELKKELKKKVVPKKTLADEQLKLLLKLFRDIDSQSS